MLAGKDVDDSFSGTPTRDTTLSSLLTYPPQHNADSQMATNPALASLQPANRRITMHGYFQLNWCTLSWSDGNPSVIQQPLPRRVAN
jgi:hypothetical protein